MPDEDKKGWEKRFEKKCLDWDKGNFPCNQVKSFIRELLAKEREKWRKEVWEHIQDFR